jgi:type IV fimbrial biogenesis protein FimT
MKQHSGFTLVELMVTIVIMAILAAIALPSFQNLITNTRIVSATNELVADLAMARSEAIKRGAGVVTVCASADGAQCSGATDWSGGRLVFVDGGAEGTVDGTDVILRLIGAATDFQMTSAGFASVGYLAYRGDGSITSNLSGTITVCKDRKSVV